MAHFSHFISTAIAFIDIISLLHIFADSLIIAWDISHSAATLIFSFHFRRWRRHFANSFHYFAFAHFAYTFSFCQRFHYHFIFQIRFLGIFIDWLPFPFHFRALSLHTPDCFHYFISDYAFWLIFAFTFSLSRLPPPRPFSSSLSIFSLSLFHRHFISFNQLFSAFARLVAAFGWYCPLPCSDISLFEASRPLSWWPGQRRQPPSWGHMKPGYAVGLLPQVEIQRSYASASISALAEALHVAAFFQFQLACRSSPQFRYLADRNIFSQIGISTSITQLSASFAPEISQNATAAEADIEDYFLLADIDISWLAID